MLQRTRVVTSGSPPDMDEHGPAVMLASFDASLGFMLAAFIAMVTAAAIIRYMSQWNERLAFLAAICTAATAIILLLQA
jgi:hypothetical protein